MISTDTLLFILMSGILLGGLYALMATGLAIVWTTLGVFNFAHGTLVALGAYVAWQVTQSVSGGLGFYWPWSSPWALCFSLGLYCTMC